MLMGMQLVCQVGSVPGFYPVGNMNSLAKIQGKNICKQGESVHCVKAIHVKFRVAVTVPKLLAQRNP